MRTLIGHIVLLAAVTFVAPPTVGGQVVESSGSDDKRIENEVRRVNAEEVQAFIHNDSKTMAHLWSDDFVVTNPLNRFVTKQQVLGMVDSGFLAIPSYDRQIEYMHVYGDVVIVAGSETVVWGGKMPNVGKTEHLRFTGVWMRRAGVLQEVARHANIVPPNPGTPGQ
ncbi:MAG: nuclear transport factor 2 family protein [Candidatus Sulfotelmatobacter sp.]